MFLKLVVGCDGLKSAVGAFRQFQVVILLLAFRGQHSHGHRLSRAPQIYLNLNPRPLIWSFLSEICEYSKPSNTWLLHTCKLSMPLLVSSFVCMFIFLGWVLYICNLFVLKINLLIEDKTDTALNQMYFVAVKTDEYSGTDMIVWVMFLQGIEPLLVLIFFFPKLVFS